MSAIVTKWVPNGTGTSDFVVGNTITGRTARICASLEGEERFEVLDWAQANGTAVALQMLDNVSYFKETDETKRFDYRNWIDLNVSLTANAA